MKRNDIKVGGHYLASVNGKITTVRLDSIRIGHGGREKFEVTNLATNRKTTFKSTAKFRSEAKPEFMAPTSGRWSSKQPNPSNVAKTGYHGEEPDPLRPSEEPEEVVDLLDLAPIEEASEESRPTRTAGSSMTPTTPAAKRDAPYVRRCYKCKEPGQPREQYGDSILCTVCFMDMVQQEGIHLPCPYTGLPRPIIENAQVKARPAMHDVAMPATLKEKLAAMRDRKQPDTGKGRHIRVPALAGTGKTTTAVEGMKECRGLTTSIKPSEQQAAIWEAMREHRNAKSICFTAYNNSIAGELKRRMVESRLDKLHCEAKTAHGMAYGALLKAFPHLRGKDPDSRRTDVLLAEALGADIFLLRQQKPVLVSAVRDLVSLVKQTLTDPTPEGLERLLDHYDVEVESCETEVLQLVPDLVERSRDFSAATSIDYDDMVWGPVDLNLPVWRHDFLIVDEYQDFNKAREQLVLKAGESIMFVGDKHQAVYGFTGAGEAMMDDMYAVLQGRGGCQSLPLTVTRRCGKAIVREAQRYVPEFEAHPSNPAGRIATAQYSLKTRWADGERKSVAVPWKDTYGPLTKPGDMVICRCNAPLVSEFFRFTAEGLRASILGRKIGDGLVQLIGRMEKRYKKPSGMTLPDLIGLLGDWRDEMTAKEMAKRNPSERKIQGFEDNVGCLIRFTKDAQTVADVRRKIASAFTDKQCPKCRKSYPTEEHFCKTPACDNAELVLPPGVKFCSGHKSKGLEADNVFWLQPEGIGPRRDKMKPWEVQQEINLEYVITTRAKECLTYVS